MKDLRAEVVRWAKWGVANEPKIHYKEIRPMPLTAKLPLTTDCSGFATLCYKLAGAPDPNGLNYNGTGYTGTLLDHGRPVTKAQPGDLVFYGPGAAFHTAIVVEGGPDPLTVSHGQERGPELVRVSQDNRQPIRFRSYLPPSPGPLRRAMLKVAYALRYRRGIPYTEPARPPAKKSAPAKPIAKKRMQARRGKP